MIEKKESRRELPQIEAEALSRRQQQVMNIVYSQAPVTARRVWELISEQPSYASVRTVLRSLVEAGHITYIKENKAFVYSPAIETERAAESALGRLVATFYKGSVANAVSGLLGPRAENLDAEELDQLGKLVEAAKSRIQKD